MNKFYFTIIFCLIFASSVLANEIIGFAKVIDGDTLHIKLDKIRLHGIDAPEKQQKCSKFRTEYNCGLVSKKALTKKINKKIVSCEVQKKKDRYGRFIGICFVGSINLNKWMTRSGYVIAYKRYSKDYIADEEYAKKNKLGLWSGSFLQPEKWRKLN